MQQMTSEYVIRSPIAMSLLGRGTNPINRSVELKSSQIPGFGYQTPGDFSSRPSEQPKKTIAEGISYSLGGLPNYRSPQAEHVHRLQGPQVAPKPEINNPVLRKVTELLEKSKKLRADQSKYLMPRDSQSTYDQKLSVRSSNNLNSAGPSSFPSPIQSPSNYHNGKQGAYKPFDRRPSQSKDYTEVRSRQPVQSANFTTTETKTNFYEAVGSSDGQYRGQTPAVKADPADFDISDNISFALRKINMRGTSKVLRNSRMSPSERISVKGAKAGRFVTFDEYSFGRMARDLEGNPYLKDLDSFKYACLVSKAALFDSEALQIGVISSLSTTSGGSQVRILLHYGNKTQNELYSFSVSPTAIQGKTPSL